MKIIYEPKGAALEYSQLALNLYDGCVHGCKYCYAPSCRFKKREDFFQASTHRANVLEKLDGDLQKMKATEDKRRVLLCFICDPYQKDNKFNYLSRECLILFRKYGIKFQVLTKGGMKASRDFDLYGCGDAYAATLTFNNEKESRKWEPNASSPASRIESLHEAKRKGIETWASFEPVICPGDTLKLIDKTSEFVDLYKIGRVNRFKTGIEVDWRRFTFSIIDKLESMNKKYYIKNSLKQYL